VRMILSGIKTTINEYRHFGTFTIWNWLTLPIVGSVLFLSVKSWAGFGNYNSILIGDLSAGMGGAATAVVGDVSSGSFYNPATLGRLKGDAFSATVGIYKKFDTVYGEDQEFAKAPLRVNQGFFRSLPASTGNVIDFRGYKLGLSIVVPDYETYRGDLKKSEIVTTSLNYVDESLWVGGSIAKNIDLQQSLGLTFYYTARSFVRSINDRSNSSATKSVIFNQERNLTENSLVGIFGYYNQLTPKWAIGVSLRPSAIRVAGEARVNESRTEMDLSGPTLTKIEPDIPTLRAPAKIAGRFSLGASYEPSPLWLWAVDANFYEGYTYEDVDNSLYSNRIEVRPVNNISIGGQWSWADWLKFRGGIYTNFSAHPNPDPELQRLQQDRLDMGGFSANFLFIAKNQVGYTFGGYYTGGRGRSIQRINQTYEVVTVTHHVFTMLVGTHFYF
jgi:hypothetical protein